MSCESCVEPVVALLDEMSDREAIAAVYGVVRQGEDANVFIGEFDADDWRMFSPVRLHRITCREVAEIRVELGGFEDASWESDHPALWQHNEPHVQLFFNSAAPDAGELAGRLRTVHRSMYGGYRSVDNDLNCAIEPLEVLLGAGSGLLACGPERAITRYVSEIAGSMSLSLLPAHQPQGGYGLLNFHERCFVVCRSVELASDAEITVS